MAGKAGTIWAQSLFWNSTYPQKVVRLFWRNAATSPHSQPYRTFIPPAKPHEEGGAASFMLRRNRNRRGFMLEGGQVHRFPADGEFDPLVRYIQADNVTQLKFRLRAALLGRNGDSFVRALHVINYFA